MARYLLDRHCLIWWAQNDKRLSEKVCQIINDEDNDIYVSAVSAWEIAIKVGVKKLSIPSTPLSFISKVIETYEFLPLSVSMRHAALVYNLPPVHNDPFDRLLITQLTPKF